MGWTRRVIFTGVPGAEAEGLLPEEHSPYPGTTGNQAPVLMDSDIEDDLLAKPENLKRVTLYYRPRDFLEWLIDNPNKGVLIGDSSLISTDLKIFNGTVIEGNDPTDPNGLTKWKRTSGSNALFGGRAIYEIFGVIDNRDIYFYQFVSKVGMCNEQIMGNFPLVPESSYQYQWLLVSLMCTPMRRVAAKLYTLRAQFMLNMDTTLGWADPCVSSQYTIETRRVPRMDGGEEIGTDVIKVDIPTGVTREVDLVPSALFQPLDNMLEVSW